MWTVPEETQGRQRTLHRDAARPKSALDADRVSGKRRPMAAMLAREFASALSTINPFVGFASRTKYSKVSRCSASNSASGIGRRALMRATIPEGHEKITKRVDATKYRHHPSLVEAKY